MCVHVCVCVCVRGRYIQRIWAVLVVMGIGLAPGVPLLTQLWESKQAGFQVISTDPVSPFLKEPTPSWQEGSSSPEPGFKANFPVGLNWLNPAAQR